MTYRHTIMVILRGACVLAVVQAVQQSAVISCPHVLLSDMGSSCGRSDAGAAGRAAGNMRTRARVEVQ